MSSAPEFGRYVLVERLAQGGMAEVFLARTGGASGFQKELVIKRILPEFSGDQQFVRMFVDEARIAAQLHHPNIVQVFDFDEVDGTYFIAMEYVEGCDLRSIMEESANHGDALQVAESLYVAMEVAKALDYAHRRKQRGKPLNIVHRDVSPHNVLVSFEAAVKLTDFGIAKAQSRATRTQEGVVKGKISYMSPEQARGRRLDGRSDLFSLGTLLFELLTLRRLFYADTDREILRKVMAADVPSPRSFRRDLPSEVERIVMRLLARQPEQRYQAAAEVLDDLSRAYHNHADGSAELVLRERLSRLFPERLSQATPASSPNIAPGSWPPNRDWPGHTGTPVMLGSPGETPPPASARSQPSPPRAPPPIPSSARGPRRVDPPASAPPASSPHGSVGSDPGLQSPAVDTRVYEPGPRVGPDRRGGERSRRGRPPRRYDRQQVVKGEADEPKDEAFFEKGTMLYGGDDKGRHSSLKPRRSVSVGAALLVATLLVAVGTLVGVLYALTRSDEPADPTATAGTATGSAPGTPGAAVAEDDVVDAIGTTEVVEGTVVIRTVPSGARVSVDGQILPGRTPLAVSVPLARPATLTVELDGFVSEALEITLEQAERPVERLIRLREAAE